MSLSEWLRDSVRRIQTDGPTGILESGRELYIGGLRRVNQVYPRGIPIFSQEWDVLILLDGCRVDLIQDIESHYSFLSDPDSIVSVGSSSLQWLERSFSRRYYKEMTQTAYITANPFSHRIDILDKLFVLDEVWRYAFDDELGTIPARPVTDRAIQIARQHPEQKLIVHYMQPHFPSIPDPIGGKLNRETLGKGAGWESPWDKLRTGQLDLPRVWQSYRKNLEYVLDDVTLLLSNIDAQDVVISADHGNAAGEWGVYGHPRVPLSVVREVPWYRTSATDERTYAPNIEPTENDIDINETLEALGYIA